MSEEAPSAEEFATWTPARDAYAQVAKETGDWSAAARQLLNRLADGLITAYADHGMSERSGKSSSMRDLVLVPPLVWKDLGEGKYLTQLLLWKTNDIEAEISPSGSSYHPATQFRFYGVRFKPSELLRLAPRAIPNLHPAETKQALGSKQESRGPAVSDAALKAWFELYQATYRGADDTEANAMSSATGMFPGKSVSRDKVRTLRGSQKRGRKPAPDNR